MGLLADEHSAVAVLLRSIGVDPVVLVAALRADPTGRASVEPYAPLVASLEMAGGIELASPRIAGLLARLMRRMITRRTAYGGPVLGCLELEMMRQAVRLNSQSVTPAHVLLAMLSLDDQLHLTGKTLAARSAPFNAGAEILRRAGVDRLGVVRSLQNTTASDRTAPAAQPGARFWTLAQPAWRPDAGAPLDRSVEIAGERGHPEAGTSHLLAALLEDRTGVTSRLLDALNIDPETVRYEVNAALAAL